MFFVTTYRCRTWWKTSIQATECTSGRGGPIGARGSRWGRGRSKGEWPGSTWRPCPGTGLFVNIVSTLIIIINRFWHALIYNTASQRCLTVIGYRHLRLSLLWFLRGRCPLYYSSRLEKQPRVTTPVARSPIICFNISLITCGTKMPSFVLGPQSAAHWSCSRTVLRIQFRHPPPAPSPFRTPPTPS